MPLLHLGTWHISDLYSQRLVRLFCYAMSVSESELDFDHDYPFILDTKLIECGYLKTPYRTRVGYVYPPPAERRQIPSVYACRPAPPLQAAQAPSIPRTPSLHSDRPRPSFLTNMAIYLTRPLLYGGVPKMRVVCGTESDADLYAMASLEGYQHHQQTLNGAASTLQLRVIYV
jgi:hypothetical protein